VGFSNPANGPDSETSAAYDSMLATGARNCIRLQEPCALFHAFQQLSERELFQLSGRLYGFPLSRKAFEQDIESLRAPEGVYTLREFLPAKGGRIPATLQIRKWQDDTAMLACIFVHPSLRRRGLGKALVSQALQFLEQKGIQRVRLNVFSDNPALALYEALGFEVCGYRNRQYPDGQVVQKLFMERMIQVRTDPGRR